MRGSSARSSARRGRRETPGSGRGEPTRAELFAAAQRLENSSWDILLDFLFGDVEVEPDPELEAAWAAECERRLREAESGKVKWIPAEEVFAKVRKSLEGPRPPERTVQMGGREVGVSELWRHCLRLPIEARLELAGLYLSCAREKAATERDRMSLQDNERWLVRVREAVARGAVDPAALTDLFEDLADVAAARRAREEAEREGTITWDEAKKELGLD